MCPGINAAKKPPLVFGVYAKADVFNTNEPDKNAKPKNLKEILENLGFNSNDFMIIDFS